MNTPETIHITHSSTDNMPRRGNSGWVNGFKEALGLRLSQLTEHPFKLELWTEGEPSACHAEIVILSPNFPPPDQEASEDARKRFYVFKTFVSQEAHRTALDTFSGYLFYRLDADTGAVQPLHAHSKGEDGACYWSRLDDLAHDLLDFLHHGRKNPFSSPCESSPPVYVAHVSEDLNEQRDAVIRELKQYGHRVLPVSLPSTDEAGFTDFVNEQMASCQLSVHLVGRRYGTGPEGSERSMMELELDAASQCCRVQSFRSLIWIKPDLMVEDMRQRRFLDAAWEASAHGCADIYEGPLAEFRETLFGQLAGDEDEELQPEDTEKSGVLLVGHPHEDALTHSLASALAEHAPHLKITVSAGGDEGSYRNHQSALISTDSVIFIPPEDPQWLQVHLLELQKAVGYGRKKPLSALAVFHAGPLPGTFQQFLDDELLVLDGSSGMTPQCLAPFFQHLEGGEPVAVRPVRSFNPFPGLRSFQSDEKHLFFAREKEIDNLLNILNANRFLALIGPSGSGKSSLVRSGLVPVLRAGHLAHAGSSWKMAALHPGDNPIKNLAEALLRAETGNPETLDPMALSLGRAVLRRGSLGLVDFVSDSNLCRKENLLILVDQFEELFRFEQEQKQGREEALAFTKLLLLATQQKRVPIYVIMTMRSDFLEYCAEFPGLIEAINRNTFLVPRMTRTQRSQAIRGPVAVGGGQISKRLVNQLINDMGEHSDPLPVLQHALMRAWDYWETHHGGDEPLDLEHYRAVGGMKEALSRHAEEAYRDLEDGRLRFCAEKVFETLTYMGPGGRGMRRPSRIDELAEIGGIEMHEVKAVVDCFRSPGRSFLRPSMAKPLTPETIVDITHESLMRVWTRLADWGDAEMRAARIYKRLVVSSARYHEGLSGLWRDPELQTALRWKEEFKPTPAWGVRYDPTYERAMLFLETSRQARDDEIVRREKEQRRQLLLRRNIAIAMGLLAILAIAFFLTAHFRGVKAKTGEEPANDAQTWQQPLPNDHPHVPPELLSEPDTPPKRVS